MTRNRTVHSWAREYAIDLHCNKVVTFVYKSKSLEPYIYSGETVTVESVGPEDINVGDIVLFAGKNKMDYLRRVIITRKKEREPSTYDKRRHIYLFQMEDPATGNLMPEVGYWMIHGKVTKIEG